MAKTRHPVLCAALCVLTLCSLSLQLGGEPTQAVRVVPFTATWVLGAVGLALLYALWLKAPRPFGRVRLWLLAAALAGVVTLGQSFVAVGTAQLLTANKQALLLAGLFWAGRTALYYVLFFFAWQGLALPAQPGRWASSRLLWPGLTVGLMVCWLPYYLAVAPGVVSNDSCTQLAQIFRLEPLSNGNPIFQTGLIWLFVQLAKPFDSPNTTIAMYCILQGALMALLLGYTLCQMAREGAPRWLAVAAFLLYALCPVFPLYAFCMGKDTNFAMAVLFFSLMVWKALTLPRRSLLPARVDIGLCLSAVLVVLLRNPGIYLVGMTLALLLLWCLRKKNRRLRPRLWGVPAAALTLVLAVYGALHGLVLPLFSIQPMPETEEYSIPLQQVARVVASQPETLSQADRDIIDALLPLDELQSAYNGELSDPIKNLWREDASLQEKKAFFALWLRLLPSHPATYFSATFHNTYGYLYPGYVSTIKPTLLIGKQKDPTGLSGYFDFSIGPHSSRLQAVMDTLMGQPLFRVLMAPGLYGWITLFAFAVLLARGGPLGSHKLLIACFPSLFTLAGCLLSAVNGYFRYAMPLYFSAPFVLLLCAQALGQAGGPSTREAGSPASRP